MRIVIRKLIERLGIKLDMARELDLCVSGSVSTTSPRSHAERDPVLTGDCDSRRIQRNSKMVRFPFFDIIPRFPHRREQYYYSGFV